MDMRGVSAAELARSVHPPISEAYISMLLSGKRRVPRDLITRRRIAEALDVPVDWIEDQRPDPDERTNR